MKSRSMQRILFIVCTILLVFVGASVKAQTNEKIPLPQILEEFEIQFDVRFSYEATSLKNFKLTSPNNFDSITEGLAYLKANTPFEYEQLDDRYITISAPYENFLCGTVIDLVTLQPISNAAIYRDDELIGTTNEAGFFVIIKEYQTTYTIQHLGYISTALTNSVADQCTTYYLSPSYILLTEVVLNSIFTRGINKRPSGFYRIQTDNFGLLPGQVDNDVLQIAQALPGVESVDETISNLNIRGGTHDENLIVWNDIRMYQSGHFFGLISAFNPDLTKRVDIYKNGTHPRYGESVSGVIAMESKNTRVEKFQGAAGFNLLNGSAYAEFPLSAKLGVQVSGRSSATSNIKTPTYKTYSQRIFQDSEIANPESNMNSPEITVEEEFNFYDLSTRILYDANENSSFQFHFLGMDNRLSFTEQIEESEEAERSGLDQRSMAGGLTWNYRFSDQVDMSLLGYGTYYLLKALNRDVFSSQELRQRNEVLETGLKWDINYSLSQSIQLEGGYQFYEVGIGNEQDVNLPRFRDYEKKVLRTHAIYLLSTWKLPRTHIEAGVRANYFGKYDEVKIEPRLSLRQTLADGWYLEIMGEAKSQSITQRIDFQSDFLGIEKRRWVLADEQNNPVITSQQISMGFQYDKRQWHLSAEGFFKNVNGITTSNQGFQNQFQFERSQGSYTVYGTELIVNRKLGNLSTWVSYLYLNNQYEFEGLTAQKFPHNLDVPHSISLAGSYTFQNFEIALGLKWRSGKPITRPIEGAEISYEQSTPSINFEAPNSSRLSDYLRTDLSANYQLRISSNLRAHISIALLNILDTENLLNQRYFLGTDSEGNPRVNEVKEYSLGFTPNFSFRLYF